MCPSAIEKFVDWRGPHTEARISLSTGMILGRSGGGTIRMGSTGGGRNGAVTSTVSLKRATDSSWLRTSLSPGLRRTFWIDLVSNPDNANVTAYSPGGSSGVS